MNTLWRSLSNVVTKTVTSLTNKSPLTLANDLVSLSAKSLVPIRSISLEALHRRNLRWLENPVAKRKTQPLNGKPFAKGVILKTLIKRPKKPNSASRKCVLVKLSTGKEMIAYVPGVGHNLQEHQIVLCRVGKLKDVPGVKIKCVRGKYDLPHVKKSTD